MDARVVFVGVEDAKSRITEMFRYRVGDGSSAQGGKNDWSQRNVREERGGSRGTGTNTTDQGKQAADRPAERKEKTASTRSGSRATPLRCPLGSGLARLEPRKMATTQSSGQRWGPGKGAMCKTVFLRSAGSRVTAEPRGP